MARNKVIFAIAGQLNPGNPQVPDPEAGMPRAEGTIQLIRDYPGTPVVPIGGYKGGGATQGAHLGNCIAGRQPEAILLEAADKHLQSVDNIPDAVRISCEHYKCSPAELSIWVPTYKGHFEWIKYSIMAAGVSTNGVNWRNAGGSITSERTDKILAIGTKFDPRWKKLFPGILFFRLYMKIREIAYNRALAKERS